MENSNKTGNINAVNIIVAIVCCVVIILSCVVCLTFAGVIDGSGVGIVNLDRAFGTIDTFIENNETEEAGQYALKVQKAMSKDADVLLILLDKISTVAPVEAYEMVKNYCEKVDENRQNETIKNMYALANAEPIQPNINPVPDTYISKPTISFTFEDGRIGHQIYYTLDGSEADENSQLYTKPFIVGANCAVNVIVLNGNGEKCENAVYSFGVDSEEWEKLNKAYTSANEECEKVDVGDEIGQCLEADKNNLRDTLLKAEDALKEGSNTNKAAAEALMKEINDNLYLFRASILADSDKSGIETAISEAENTIRIAEDSGYSSYCTSYVNDIKAQIENCEAIRDRRSATQEEVNASLDTLSAVKNKLDYKIGYINFYAETVESMGGSGYYLYDINKDGISELIVHTGDYYADEEFVVFTYNGDGERLGQVSAGETGLYRYSGNGVLTWRARMDSETITRLYISGGSLWEEVISDNYPVFEYSEPSGPLTEYSNSNLTPIYNS